MGHPGRRSRHGKLAGWAAQPEVRGAVSVVYLAHVGILSEPWLLPIHERIHDRHWSQRRDGVGVGELSAGTAGRASTASGSPSDESASVVRRWIWAGYVPADEDHNARLRLAL